MEQLLEILSEIQPDVDYKTCTTLIDDEWLDSFAILSIVSELEEAFDIGITPADIVPENFNSAQALYQMAFRRKDKHVVNFHGISAVCASGSGGILSDSKEISVAVAVGVQLYLLCIIGSEASPLFGVYDRYNLCGGETSGKSRAEGASEEGG